MNIFYLNSDPRKCAEYHVNRHVVKMILEYAQLLSTAHRVLDGIIINDRSKTGRKQTRYVLSDSRESVIYSATHINHPSAKWVRESDKNYDWLYVMWCELMDEYTYRYYKVHACEKLIIPLRHVPYNIPKGEFTEPTPAMPELYKVSGDSIQSYINYYNGDKRRMFSWKDRSTPPFIIESRNV